MSIRHAAAVLVLAVILTGCGEKNSYNTAEAALRVWLVAAHEGDEAACDQMTVGYRQELFAASPANSSRAECGLVLAAVASDSMPALPPADAEMNVPAWDPSGEALIEVNVDDAKRAQFWMQWDGDRWLVAGRED